MKKIKLNKNKNSRRGQVGESLSDLVALIFIIILLIVFFVISKAFWDSSSAKIEKVADLQSEHNQEHIALESWLQKPITLTLEGYNQNMKIIDFISIYKATNDENYKNLIDGQFASDFKDDYELKILDSIDQTINFRPVIDIASIVSQTNIFIRPEFQSSGAIFYIPFQNKYFIVSLNKK